jgi:predicted PurR-regulated permease PerM
VPDDPRPAEGTDLADVARTNADEQPPEPVPLPSPLDVRSLALTVIAVILILAGLRVAQPVLVPVAFGILISYALDPVVTTLVRWRVPRVLAATLILTLALLGTSWLGWGLSDDVVSVAEKLPRAAQMLRERVRDMRGKPGKPAGAMEHVQEAASTLEATAEEAAGRQPSTSKSLPRVRVEQPPLDVGSWLVAGSLGAIEFVAQATVVFFLALYLLASGDLFKRKLVKIAGPTLTKKKITVQILDEINRQVAAFLLIRIVITIILSVATWLALRAIGLEQAALWGIAAGVLNIIPYIGPVVVAVIVAVIAFVQFGTIPMAAAASGITAVLTTIEGYWLTPWLTSRAAQMNAVAVFVGLLFWGWLWGLPGLLLAVPLVMVVKAVCDRVEGLQAVGEMLGE